VVGVNLTGFFWLASSPDLAERTEPMRHAMEASA
jgi:hypothetical protein